MNASKENAREAIKKALKLQPTPKDGRAKALAFVLDFLDIACQKLPSEAWLKRDRTKKKLMAGLVK